MAQLQISGCIRSRKYKAKVKKRIDEMNGVQQDNLSYQCALNAQMIIAFPLKCPEPAQWSIRARGHCPDPSKYFCLKNDLINGFSENCTVFDFHQPGRKSVLRGGLDADICSEERYHPWPIKFYTNVSTGCIFLKSACNEEGQLIYGNGNRSTDISCRCDYTRGYDFLVKPRNPCFCVPAEEDCLCYLKTCVDSKYMLSPDYQCIHVMNTSVAHCKPILNERLNRHRNRENKQNQTQDLTRKENISSHARWTIIVRISVTGLFFGLISVYCIHKLIQHFCRKEHLARSKSDEMEIETSKKQLAKSVREEFGIMKSKKQLAKSNSDEMEIGTSKKQLARSKSDEMEIGTSKKQLVKSVSEEIDIMKSKGKRKGTSGFMIDTIERWERDDTMYINTRATTYVLNCFEKHNCVSVIGPSGSGKTALVRHVALQMEQKEAFRIITVTGAKEIKEQYESKRKTLYVVDDMCGNFTANHNRLEEWKNSMADITNILEYGYCKLILTCRLQVFQDEEFTNLRMFQTCKCNLASDGLSLTSYEKQEMTKQFFKEHASKALQHLGQYEFLPLLCKFYDGQRGDPNFKLDLFLKDPFSFYENELTDMLKDSKEGMFKCCALLLLVIFNNRVEVENLSGKDAKVKKIMRDISRVCQIKVTDRKLKTQLNMLIGTFVTYEEGIYRTIHDKMFDFLAFHFGKQDRFMKILIIYGKDSFIRERFVTSKETVKNYNESGHYLILIPEDKLPIYIKRVVDDMVGSSFMYSYIEENINFKNVKFCKMLRDVMRNLQNHAISALIKKASKDFFFEMFVLRDIDIDDMCANNADNYRCYGIILHEDILHHYIDRWFREMTIEDNYLTISHSRILKSVTFFSALRTYMRQLNKKTIASLIKSGCANFISKMFVMTENDIKSYNYVIRFSEISEYIGIVIPDDLIQQYIRRLFECLTRSFSVETFLKKNRPLMQVKFRTAMRTYIRELNANTLESLIQNASNDFICTMFVMKEENIKDNTENRHECLSIVIRENLLHQFIIRWLNYVITSVDIQILSKSRLLMNVTFRNALSTFMKKLSTDTIAKTIQHANYSVIDSIFVMTEEDIKDDVENRYECLSIVIPDELVEPYIEKWIGNLEKFEYYFKKRILENRLLNNAKFRSALQNYLRKLNTDKISSLIHNACRDFLCKIFVVSGNDIIDCPKYRYIYFGIVIPKDLIQQYIAKWFEYLTQSYGFMKMNKSRPLMNASFRTTLRTYVREFGKEKIESLIRTGSDYFCKTMFVITEDNIKDDAENKLETFGIIIPYDLLQLYIDRWFKFLIRSYSINSFLKESKLYRHVSFRAALWTYMQQLNIDDIDHCCFNDHFLHTLFVKAEYDIEKNAKSGCVDNIMFIDLLQQFIKLWLQIFKSVQIPNFINRSRLVINAKFRNALLNYLRQLDTDKIASLILNGRENFLSTMFVMTTDDFKENADEQHECIGIVIPDVLLQQYIEKWFTYLIRTNRVKEFMNRSRILMNATFCTAMRNYMRSFSKEKIDNLIQNGEVDFLNTMFVITENDIKTNAENRYENFGIVIIDDMIPHFIEKWFQCLTNTVEIKEFLNRSRLLTNMSFRHSLRDYMRQLDIDKIDFLMNTGSSSFINTMFVVIEDDIKDNTENRYEHVGIVIPKDVLQQFIGRWFHCFTKTESVAEYINESRLPINVTGRTAIQYYVSQITEDTLETVIQTSSSDFCNKMFVMTGDDIKDNDVDQYKSFGIVIPDNLLQQYIGRLYAVLTKADSINRCITDNRCFMNVNFRKALQTYTKQLTRGEIENLIRTGSRDFFNSMFVMTKNDIRENSENQYGCFGIVLPDELLQQYIERLFYGIIAINSLDEDMNVNRVLLNVTGRSAMRHYIKQIKEERIWTLIQTESRHFINIMFVISENDIKDNSENQFECVGIVIPEDLLPQYIESLFDSMISNDSVKKHIGSNRCFMNVNFRKALQTYTKQLTRGKIESLIRTGSKDFVSTMFVFTEIDIKDNSENLFECIGIVIPDDLLSQYIGRLLDGMTKTDSVKKYIDANRCFMNFSFRKALQTYTKQLTTGKIENLIRTGSRDFVSTMFVMIENDIKDNSDNLFECFGIVLPDDLLQQYIDRLFDGLTKTDSVKKFINANRCFMNATFRIFLQTYMKELTQENIANLIRTGSRDFANTMFVITEDDIKDDSENRHEHFALVIPVDMLYQYIERWFDSMTKIDSAKQFIDASRIFTCSKFQITLDSYINGIDAEKMALLNRKGHIDFLNTRRELLKENSTYEIKS